MSAAAEEMNNLSNSGIHNLKPVRDSIGELRALCQRKIDAQESFNDACKAVADKAGLRGPVLAQYVTALVKDKEDEYHEKATQLGLLFDEMD